MTSLDTFLGKVVDQIVNPLILLLSAVALVVFAWGVVEFIYKAGDESGREQGRRAIVWGIVGFVIIFGAYGLINLALGTFGLGTIQDKLPAKSTSL
jgi:hypothetical protein